MSSKQSSFPVPHFEPEANEAVAPSQPDLSAEKNLDLAHSSPLPADSTRLISSVLQLMGNLEQDKVLQSFVDQACEVTSSPYGALSILGSRGETSAF